MIPAARLLVATLLCVRSDFFLAVLLRDCVRWAAGTPASLLAEHPASEREKVLDDALPSSTSHKAVWQMLGRVANGPRAGEFPAGKSQS